MASGTVAPPQPSPTPRREPTPQYEAFIEDRLRYTRQQVKLVDVAGGMMVLAAGLLVYLLAVGLLDHWIVPGGLGFWPRLLLLVGLLAGGGTYFWQCVLPPLRSRVNPVFAAETIERSRPSLKNSLINFLLLRRHREEVLPVVYQALEHRAAADLSQVRIESAVNRVRTLRLACVLTGVLLVFLLYMLLSPKSLFTSISRVIWPWGGAAAPTRVSIEALEPGNATRYLGDTVTISARVTGLHDDEPVTLFHSTADGQIVNQETAMTSADGFNYRCTLPPGDLGLQQDMTYYLSAGDCTTPPYKIEVQVAPAILVSRVEYHYPPYTGIPDRTQQDQGDIRAIEGTWVRIHATANRKIRLADIELMSGDGRHATVSMSPDGKTAHGVFTLRLSRDDPAKPEYDSYQLLFTDEGDRKNPRPVRYRIEVLRDLPPEVQIVSPKEEEVTLAADGRLPIRVRAQDPDYALQKVLLGGKQSANQQHGEQGLPIAPLFPQQQTEKPWRGPFEKSYVFEPSKLGLKAGDRVTYWAEAEDNKDPNPNRVRTDERRIVIVGPAAAGTPHRADPRQRPQGEPNQPNQANPEQSPRDPLNPPDKPDREKPNQPGQPDQPNQPPEKQPPGQENEPNRDNAAGETPQPGDNSGGRDGNAGSANKDGSGKENQAGSKNEAQRIDPNTQQGDAIQKMLDDRDKQQQQTARNQNQQQGGSPDNQQAGKGGSENKTGDGTNQQPQLGGQPNSSQQAGKSGSENKTGDGTNQQPQPGGQPNSSQQAGKGGSEQKTGDGTNQQPQPGGQPNSSQQAGKGGSENKTGDGTNQQPQSGGQPNSSQQAGKSGSENKTGDGTNQQSQPGGQPNSSQQAGKGGSENKTGDGTNQQPQPGEPGQHAKPGSKDGTGGGEKPSEQQLAKSDRRDGQPGSRDGSGPKGDRSPNHQTPRDGAAADGAKPSPEPQGDNRPRSKDGSGEPADRQPSSDQPQTTSTSPKQSTAKGQNDGDRSGHGKPGGGQDGNKPGKGAQGTQSPDKAGSKSNEPGSDETGDRPGDKVAAKQPTGAHGKPAPGDQANRRQPGEQGTQQPGGAPDNGPAADRRQADRAAGDKLGGQNSNQPGKQARGNPTTGGMPGNQDTLGPDAPPAEQAGPDPANLEFSRKQTDLALEHLKEQMAKERSDLLEQLGWSREEAQKFLDYWKKMEESAAQKGPQGEAARQSLNEALKSLGLRPRGTQLQRGNVKDKLPPHLSSGGHFDPPGEWAEPVHEYQRGVAGGR